MDVDLEKVVRNPFFAGALGSLAALRFVPGVTWLERFGNVAAGSLSAGFAGPALAEWLQITSANMASGVSFGVGMFGLSLAAAVIDGVRQVKLGDVITSWVTRRGQ